ncbi:phage tail sheath subtilisin-like domain-containing protein [Rodentibacter pneumotropicus]|nr:phage tail sheath subtilisin-like domain-containing protein [Rodentibacter pneumotropicus]NBH76187.1 phage tail protein [Rodentibacter pneumotropicus]THA08355.1 phage tail protein [Rodentibacter pneumotropicus]THA12577.1 phage tail protein [Rodentibacter pneumotropicus]
MADTNIEFDNIPTSIRQPGVYTEYNAHNAVSTLPTNEQNVLIVAPMLGGDTAFSAPTPIYSDTDAKNAFGAGSWAHLMARVAIQNNAMIRLTAIGLKDNEAGVAATGSIALSGTATTAGVLKVMIGGVDYAVAISKAETADHVASRLNAVINAGEYCPITAAVEEGTVSLTAKCKGEIGNEIEVSAKITAGDMAVNATTLANGAENADLAAALASVAGEHYHVIISPFADDKNAKALREHLDTVASPMEKKPGVGVLGWRGSMASGTTYAGKINDKRVTVGWYKGVVESNALIAAGFGAIIAGEEDPAKPLNTLEIKGLTPVSATETPLKTEVNQSLFHGLTPIMVVNNRVQIVRAITTYTKSPANVDDPAWLDLTTIRTLDYTRKAIEQRIALRFPRSKLSNRTPPKVRSEILDVLYRLENLEILENVDMHKGKLLVVRNGQDPNRLDTAIPADVVNGLHVVANRIDLIL